MPFHLIHMATIVQKLSSIVCNDLIVGIVHASCLLLHVVCVACKKGANLFDVSTELSTPL